MPRLSAGRRRPKGVVFVGPVIMSTLKQALRRRRKEPLPKVGAKYVVEPYQPLAMHGMERISVIKDLVRQGYRVVVPVRKFDLRKGSSLWLFVSRARKAGARIVDSEVMFSPPESNPMFGSEGPDPYRSFSPASSWMADSHRVIGRNVHAVSNDSVLHLRLAGVKVPVRISTAGESGAIVGHGRVLLATKRVSSEDVARLRKQGHRVYVMPTFSVQERQFYRPGHYVKSKELSFSGKKKWAPVMKKESHLDMRINLIERGNLIIVEPDYYKANRRLVDKIAAENGFKVRLVSGKDIIPTNFLWLPDGRIMITKSPRLKRLLEREGLRESRDFIVSSREIHYNRYLGGGLGCFATAMPYGGPVIKQGKFRRLRHRSTSPVLFDIGDVERLRETRFLVSQKTGKAYYGIDSVLRARHEQFSFHGRERGEALLESRIKFASCGALQHSTRAVFIGQEKFTEHLFKPTKNALRVIIPGKQVIGAIKWLEKQPRDAVFEEERVEYGPELGSETNYWISVSGQKRAMTEQERQLNHWLGMLASVGLIKDMLLSGDGIFEYRKRYSVPELPKAWAKYF